MPNWLLHLIPMFVTYHVYSKGDEISEKSISSTFSYAPNWVECEGDYIGEFSAFCWLCWSPDVWTKYNKIVETYMTVQALSGRSIKRNH